MTIFISGSGTGVGKTYITTKIAKSLMSRGIDIAISKPIETGVSCAPLDALTHATTQNRSVEEICFYQFSLPSAPFVADKENIIDVQHIINRLRFLESNCDILLVEGAGGLFVPIKEQYFMLDLACDLEAFCVVVTHSSLGCINDVLSARSVLDSQNLDFISVINVFDVQEFENISYPFIRNLKSNFIYPLQESALIDFIVSLMDLKNN